LTQNKLVTVLGQLNDEQELQVLKIFASPEIPAPNSSADEIYAHHEVMVFAGPYSLDGSTFTAFDPIFERVTKARPSLVILMGPFFDRNLPVLKKCVYLNSKNMDRQFDFQKRRQDQLKLFCDRVTKNCQGKTKIAIIPDQNEVDCMYPYPVPPSALDFQAENDDV